MTKYLNEALSGDGILTITMSDPSGPMNRTTAQFKAELDALLDKVETNPPRGMIFLTDRSAFGVGGDVDQIAALASAGAQESYADSQRIKALYRRIEKLPLPVVALIEGMAVGGSFELVLACHAGFALDDNRIRLGFPECSIGLIPGAGGVVRSVHLMGCDAAIPMIVDSKLITPEEACTNGLLIGLANSREALLIKALAWIAHTPTPQKPWDQKRHRVPGGGLFDRRERYLAMQGRVSGHIKRGYGHQMAEITALSAICDVAACGFADGEKIESHAFARQATSPEASARIGLMIKDKSSLKQAASRPQAVPPQTLPKKVGVLGAGLMGAGIAYSNALAGYNVVLADISATALERGLDQIRADIARAVRRKQITEAKGAEVLFRVSAGENIASLRGCDLMIEAVFEDIDLKKSVLRDMENLLVKGGHIASNTSTLSISDIGEVLDQPDRFIGLHFFSPVDRIHLVEVVIGKATSDTTLALAHDYTRSLRKQAITVADSHGFFASRVFQKFIYEAAALIGEGVPATLVENAALQSGYPAGPLSLMDDTALTLSMKVIEHAAHAATAQGEPPESTTVDEISERLFTAQVCDVLRCLHHGIIQSAAEVNVGAIKAIGFPAWTGGPLRLVAQEGVAKFLARSQALAEKHGDRFALPFASAETLEALINRAISFDTETIKKQG